MRVLTFSIVRGCRLKCARPRQVVARARSDSAAEIDETKYTALEDGPLVVAVGSWPAEFTALRDAALRDMRVLPHFLSEREEAAMLLELEPRLRRMRYEFDHWDNAIHGFRETEKSDWGAESDAVLCRVRAAAFGPGPPAQPPLPTQHVLDLAPGGFIKPHIDSVRFCGDVIAGLCLLSSAVMRFTHVKHELTFEALLPRRGLYIMKGVARYDFNHEVVGGAHSVWRGVPVPRGRRVAVLTRAQPQPEAALLHEPETTRPAEGAPPPLLARRRGPVTVSYARKAAEPPEKDQPRRPPKIIE